MKKGQTLVSILSWTKRVVRLPDSTGGTSKFDRGDISPAGRTSRVGMARDSGVVGLNAADPGFAWFGIGGLCLGAGGASAATADLRCGLCVPVAGNAGAACRRVNVATGAGGWLYSGGGRTESLDLAGDSELPKKRFNILDFKRYL